MTLTLPRVTLFALLITLGLSSGANATPQQCYDAYNRADYTSAYRLCQTEAVKGDAYAQVFLGVMYNSGLGVPKSFETAVAWYRKAADQGNAFGQVNLGRMYESGRGVPKSFETAVAWYRKAAAQGNADAKAALTRLGAP